MAQWIRRPPTERKIPGSIPGVEALLLLIQAAYRILAEIAVTAVLYRTETKNVLQSQPFAFAT